MSGIERFELRALTDADPLDVAALALIERLSHEIKCLSRRISELTP